MVRSAEHVEASDRSNDGFSEVSQRRFALVEATLGGVGCGADVEAVDVP
jgi:hypothetical protein